MDANLGYRGLLANSRKTRRRDCHPHSGLVKVSLVLCMHVATPIFSVPFFQKDLLSLSSLFHLICFPHLLLRGHVVAPLHHPIVVAQSRAVPAGTRAETNSHRRRFHRSTCLPIWTPPHPTPGRAGSAVRMPHNTPVDEYRACRRVKVDRRRAVHGGLVTIACTCCF